MLVFLFLLEVLYSYYFSFCANFVKSAAILNRISEVDSSSNINISSTLAGNFSSKSGNILNVVCNFGKDSSF